MFKRLLDQIYNWFITISDIGAEFGLDVSPFYKDEQLGNKVTELFKDTKCTVYVFRSKYLHSKAYPGSIYFSNPWILKFKAIPDIKGAYILTIIDKILTFCQLIEGIINGAIRAKNNSGKLIYDPITKKFDTSFKECNIFITTSLVELFDENELISWLIYKAGFETYAFYINVQKFFNKTLELGKFMIGLKTIWNICNSVDSNDLINSIKSALKMLTVLLAGSILLKFLFMYPTQRRQIYTQEFPIKFGYGKYFISAMTKFTNYVYSGKLSGEDKIKNINIIDKLLLNWHRIWISISIWLTKYGLDNTLTKEQRIELLKDRLNKFENEYIINNPIDRTEHISSEMPQVNPVITYSDKFYKKIGVVK